MPDTTSVRCDFCGGLRSPEAVQRGECCRTVHEVPLLVESANGRPIHSVEDWFVESPPKGKDKQWKDGFSAKECAKAWFRRSLAAVPEELTALFDTRDETRGLRAATVIPELATALDVYRGPRHADAVLMGLVGGRRTLVSIEAKAGEPFADEIGPYLLKVRKSKVPARIDGLAQAVFGMPVVTINPALEHLRYQLLHALAGALIEARNRGAVQALFVVHQLATRGGKAVASFVDFQNFVRVLTHNDVAALEPGVLMRVSVPGNDKVPGDLPVYVGWANAPGLEGRAEADLKRVTLPFGFAFDETLSIALMSHLRDEGVFGDEDWQRIQGWLHEAMLFLSQKRESEHVSTPIMDPRDVDWQNTVRAWHLAGYRLPRWATLWLWRLGRDLGGGGLWAVVRRSAAEMRMEPIAESTGRETQ